MGKWAIGILLVLAITAIVVLDQMDILNWQPLSMLVAAVAAPFKLIIGAFSNKEEEIRKKHQEARQMEADYQADLESKIRARERRIEELDIELEQVDANINSLKEKRARIGADVDAMSSEELGETVRDLLRSRRSANR